jgi:carbon monoxide dehydrogenase subunit G
MFAWSMLSFSHDSNPRPAPGAGGCSRQRALAIICIPAEDARKFRIADSGASVAETAFQRRIVIQVSERIEAPAPPQAVWAVLSDPSVVVECVPGASLGERHEDGSYDAAMTVKFGPAKVTFRSRFTLELDEPSRSGRVASRARDNQGGTRVRADMQFRVEEGATPGSSAIGIDAQVEISGKLASLVESGANLVVKQMTKAFSERLAAKLGGAAN